MSEEVNMNEKNGEELVVNEENGEEADVLQHIDCSDAFNTSRVSIWFCFLLK